MSIKHQHWRCAQVLCYDGELNAYILWCKECGAYAHGIITRRGSKRAEKGKLIEDRTHVLNEKHIGYLILAPGEKSWVLPLS